MPNNNDLQQTKDDGQQTAVTFPSVSVEDTLPPTITTTTATTSSPTPQDTLNPSPATDVPTNNGSAAPNNDLNISGVVGTTPPKKKFAGGKVIATILGLFLLVGGVGAGVFLTSQNQNIEEKAGNSCGSYTQRSDCIGQCSPEKGDPPKSWECKWHSGNNNCYESGTECGGSTGGSAPAERSCDGCTVPTGSNPGQYSCSGNGYTSVNYAKCDGCGGKCIRGDLLTNGCLGYCGGTIGGDSDLCDSNGCSCDKCETDNDCFVVKYTCNGMQPPAGGCSSNPSSPSKSQTFNNNLCEKNQQIDISCIGTCKPDGSNCFVEEIFPPCGTEPPGSTAQCSSVKAYNDSWVLLTNAKLSDLKAGDSVNFCVNGISSSGSFDKARFTINGTLRPITTTKRPTTNDFCDHYVIPVATNTFNITAQIHHVTQGWK